MPGVWLNQGLALMAQWAVNKTAPQNLVLCQYKSNTTPSNADTEATYTEADYTGYAEVALTPATWGYAGTAILAASYPAQGFIGGGTNGVALASGTQNVYGYFVKETTSGKAIFAERFTSAPWIYTNGGDDGQVSASVTFQDKGTP